MTVNLKTVIFVWVSNGKRPLLEKKNLIEKNTWTKLLAHDNPYLWGTKYDKSEILPGLE
jgi:hypothetical protein